MKKVLFSTAAIVALSFSAFAGTPESKGEAKPEVKVSTSTGELHWFNVPASGTPVFQNTATEADEIDLTGCDGPSSRPPCERGYRDDQLNTPGNPSSGVKSSQLANPDRTIYREM